MTKKQPFATAFVVLMKKVAPEKTVWFVGPKPMAAVEMIKQLEAGNRDALQRCRYVLDTIVDLLKERALNETPTLVSTELREMAETIDAAPLHTLVALEPENYGVFLSSGGEVSRDSLIDAFKQESDLSVEYVGAVLAFIELFLNSKTGLSWS